MVWGRRSAKTLDDAQVRAALSSITLPDGALLSESKRLSGISVRDGVVSLSIEVNANEATQFESVRQAAAKAVEELSGVKKVHAVLTEHQAAGSSRPAPKRAEIHHHKAGNAKSAAPKSAGPLAGIASVKRLIAVASGKGGVGKSTVSVNLAVALQRQGLAVGVLDADIYGPSMPRLLGSSQKPEPGGEDGRLIPVEAHGLKVMSMGFIVDEGSAMIWRGPMVQSALVQMLRDVEWGALDVLIIDMPPGTGDAQLTLAQQAPLAGGGDRFNPSRPCSH